MTHPKIPTKTVQKMNGPITYVDDEALLDRWDDLGPEVWTLDSGDLHNVINCAIARIDALRAERDRLRAALVAALDAIEDHPGVAEMILAAALSGTVGEQ